MTDFFLLFGGTVSSLEKDGGAVFICGKVSYYPIFVVKISILDWMVQPFAFSGMKVEPGPRLIAV